MSGGIRAVAGLVVGLWLALALGASAVSMSPTVARATGSGRGEGLVTGRFQPPVGGAVLTQPFGCSVYPFEPVEPACPARHWHSGVDLAAPAGTSVHATLGGRARVIVAAGGYGLHVVIDHGTGLSSLYGHLSEVTVSDGAVVLAGATIGVVGSTGNSTGPHLHFEIRRDGIPEDPRLDLSLP
ncbi:MAG: M23 family metallopeptidase [Candidatus Dormibacteria bacterium]